MHYAKHLSSLRRSQDLFKRVLLTDPARNYLHPALTFSHVRPALWTVSNTKGLMETPQNTMLREYVDGKWEFRFENNYTQNLIYTNDFENAAWTKSSVDVVAGNSITGPFGLPVKAFAGQAGSSLKRLRQNKSTTTTGDWSMVWVIKAGSEVNADFVLQDQSANNSSRFRCNLQTGVISNPSVAGTAVSNLNKAFVLQDGFVIVSLSATFSTALTQLQAIVTWDTNGVSSTTGTLYPACCNLTNTKYPTPLSIATNLEQTIDGFELTALTANLGVTLTNGFTVGLEGKIHGSTGQVQNFIQLDNDSNIDRFQVRPVIAATGFFTEVRVAGTTITSNPVTVDATLYKKTAVRLNLTPAIARAGLFNVTTPVLTNLNPIATWTHLRIGSSRQTDRMCGYLGQSWLSSVIADDALLTAASL